MKIMLSLALAMAFATAPAIAEEDLFLVSPSGPPVSNYAGTGYLDQIAVEAFRRVGLKASVTHQTIERSILSLKSGLVDGIVLAAGAAIEKMNPRAVVPSPSFRAYLSRYLYPIRHNGWDLRR